MDKSLEKAAADGKILPKGLTAADSANTGSYGCFAFRRC